MKISERPIVNLPVTRSEVVCEVFAALMTCSLIGIVVFYYTHLPENVVVHFDISGAADGTAPKIAYLIFSGMAIVIYALLTLLATAPQNFFYMKAVTADNAADQYLLARKFIGVMKLEIEGLMFFFLWNAMQVSMDSKYTFDATNVITLLVLLPLTVGMYMLRSARQQP